MAEAPVPQDAGGYRTGDGDVVTGGTSVTPIRLRPFWAASRTGAAPEVPEAGLCSRITGSRVLMRRPPHCAVLRPVEHRCLDGLPLSWRWWCNQEVFAARKRRGRATGFAVTSSGRVVKAWGGTGGWRLRRAQAERFPLAGK